MSRLPYTYSIYSIKVYLNQRFLQVYISPYGFMTAATDLNIIFSSLKHNLLFTEPKS